MSGPSRIAGATLSVATLSALLALAAPALAQQPAAGSYPPYVPPPPPTGTPYSPPAGTPRPSNTPSNTPYAPPAPPPNAAYAPDTAAPAQAAPAYGQPAYGQPAYGQPAYAPAPTYAPAPVAAPAPASTARSDGEMNYLYATSVAYGIGTGIWVDALGKVKDPGFAFLAPLLFGAAAPVGVYLWDASTTIHRGVPSATATGLWLGAVEGAAIAGTQWQYSGHGGPSTWSLGVQSSLTWGLATGGAVGGFLFGEWFDPDPRSVGLIASAAGWGAISGSFIGAGASGSDWKDGASVGGLVGYNAGIVLAGALSTVYVPSWKTQKAMWIGYLVGTAASSLVYLFYLTDTDADPKHGLIANGVGGLAGVLVAAAITASATDDTASSQKFSPPVQLGVASVPGGAGIGAYGSF